MASVMDVFDYEKAAKLRDAIFATNDHEINRALVDFISSICHFNAFDQQTAQKTLFSVLFPTTDLRRDISTAFRDLQDTKDTDLRISKSRIAKRMVDDLTLVETRHDEILKMFNHLCKSLNEKSLITGEVKSFLTCKIETYTCFDQSEKPVIKCKDARFAPEHEDFSDAEAEDEDLSMKTQEPALFQQSPDGVITGSVFDVNPKVYNKKQGAGRGFHRTGFGQQYIERQRLLKEAATLEQIEEIVKGIYESFQETGTDLKYYRVNHKRFSLQEIEKLATYCDKILEINSRINHFVNTATTHIEDWEIYMIYLCDTSDLAFHPFGQNPTLLDGVNTLFKMDVLKEWVQYHFGEYHLPIIDPKNINATLSKAEFITALKFLFYEAEKKDPAILDIPKHTAVFQEVATRQAANTILNVIGNDTYSRNLSMVAGVASGLSAAIAKYAELTEQTTITLVKAIIDGLVNISESDDFVDMVVKKSIEIADKTILDDDIRSLIRQVCLEIHPYAEDPIETGTLDLNQDDEIIVVACVKSAVLEVIKLSFKIKKDQCDVLGIKLVCSFEDESMVPKCEEPDEVDLDSFVGMSDTRRFEEGMLALKRIQSEYVNALDRNGEFKQKLLSIIAAFDECFTKFRMTGQYIVTQFLVMKDLKTKMQYILQKLYIKRFDLHTAKTYLFECEYTEHLCDLLVTDFNRTEGQVIYNIAKAAPYLDKLCNMMTEFYQTVAAMNSFIEPKLVLPYQYKKVMGTIRMIRGMIQHADSLKKIWEQTGGNIFPAFQTHADFELVDNHQPIEVVVEETQLLQVQALTPTPAPVEPPVVISEVVLEGPFTFNQDIDLAKVYLETLKFIRAKDKARIEPLERMVNSLKNIQKNIKKGNQITTDLRSLMTNLFEVASKFGVDCQEQHAEYVSSFPGETPIPATLEIIEYLKEMGASIYENCPRQCPSEMIGSDKQSCNNCGQRHQIWACPCPNRVCKRCGTGGLWCIHQSSKKCDPYNMRNIIGQTFVIHLILHTFPKEYHEIIHGVPFEMEFSQTDFIRFVNETMQAAKEIKQAGDMAQETTNEVLMAKLAIISKHPAVIQFVKRIRSTIIWGSSDKEIKHTPGTVIFSVGGITPAISNAHRAKKGPSASPRKKDYVTKFVPSDDITEAPPASLDVEEDVEGSESDQEIETTIILPNYNSLITPKKKKTDFGDRSHDKRTKKFGAHQQSRGVRGDN
jgi:hypothetical protein